MRDEDTLDEPAGGAAMGSSAAPLDSDSPVF
jgi:hypothetical protein